MARIRYIVNIQREMFAKCGLNPKEGTEIGIEMGMSFSKIKIKLLVDLADGAADFQWFSNQDNFIKGEVGIREQNLPTSRVNRLFDNF